MGIQLTWRFNLTLLFWTACCSACSDDQAIVDGTTADAASEDSLVEGPLSLPDGWTLDDAGQIHDPDGTVVDMDGKVFAGDGAIVVLDSPDGEAAPVSCKTYEDCTGIAACIAFQCDTKSHTCVKNGFAQGPCTLGPASCGANGYCVYGRCVANSPICVGNVACCPTCQLDSQCDDGSSCTTDTCDPATHTCTYALTAACSAKCASDADCTDGSTATADSCVDGICQHSFVDSLPPACPEHLYCTAGLKCSGATCDPDVPLCTLAPKTQCKDTPCKNNLGGICDDGNPCTNDLCGDDGKCLHTAEVSCGAPACQTDGDCDDHDVCTADSCVLGASTMKICFHAPDLGVTGCCATNAQCDDGKACTQDSCIGGKCQYKAGADCTCKNAADCGTYYMDPCSFPTCDAGHCILQPIPNCECKGLGGWSYDNSCDDHDPCTQTTCVAGKCLSRGISCNDNDPCTRDICAAQGCVHVPIPGCLQTACATTGDCLDADLCTEDYCVNAQCKRVPRYCDDGRACTADSCDPKTGSCTHAPITGCKGFGG